VGGEKIEVIFVLIEINGVGLKRVSMWEVQYSRLVMRGYLYYFGCMIFDNFRLWWGLDG
jgi:hypothetical protein